MKKTTAALVLLFSVFTTPVQGAEAFPTIGIGGRMQVDTTLYDNDRFDYEDGSELRRGRLYIGGNLNQDWDYRIQYDWAPDEPELRDGYVRYNGIANTRLTFGNFKQFSSLEELTSSNNITFTERALPNVMTTSRRMGAGIQHWNDRFSVAASAYTHEANNNQRGSGVAGRFAYRPSLGDNILMHLGINVARENPDDDVHRLRARPDSHQDSHRIVDTGTLIDVDDFTKVGLEAAYVNGRISAQAEYIRQDVSRGLGDVDFAGYYVYVSYFLTDHSRPYRTADAIFDTVDPGSSGAWEVAARLSNIDLTDADVAGGAVDTLTLGVNYYINRDLRLTGNFIMADSDDVAGDDDPSVWQFRLRYTF